MSRPHKQQNLFDWMTQKWVLRSGKKLSEQEHSWLNGPFGEPKGIGEKFIYQLADREQLNVKRNYDGGLLSSFQDLQLDDSTRSKISESIVHFYENTSNYNLKLNIHWNPFFKVFGWLLGKMFTQRIQQLNIPLDNPKDDALTNEIIHLCHRETHAIKYTIWLRKFKSTGSVVYSGIYGINILPNGKPAVKALFALPHGSATVLLQPQVTPQGDFMLNASGRRFGDQGFYFLLEDTSQERWAKYIKSFSDQLIVRDNDGKLEAIQNFTFWKMRVITMHYQITRNSD